MPIDTRDWYIDALKRRLRREERVEGAVTWQAGGRRSQARGTPVWLAVVLVVLMAMSVFSFFKRLHTRPGARSIAAPVAKVPLKRPAAAPRQEPRRAP